MAKRAVLVGINYPGTENELAGCVNDVVIVKDLLVESYGFDENDMTVLLDGKDVDGDYQKPTAQNIMVSGDP
jgi:archaellum component FlaG (FlaF/FlaG flagellin family)